MEEIVVHGKRFVRYISDEQIQNAIVRVANKLKKDFADKDPLYVCIMNGAFMFAAELMRALDQGGEVAFARYSSYAGMQSTMELREIMPVSQDLTGRSVIIVEDLIDTGYTVDCVTRRFYELGAKEVHVTALLSKPDAHRCPVDDSYIALEIENKFIVGHGLDYDERGRMYQDIYKLKED